MESAGGTWTVPSILRESERWTHVPRGGVLFEDEHRFLVHLPAPRNTSRVWRSRAANEEECRALIEDTIQRTRGAGCSRLIWHAGDPVAPPFLDELLLRRGFAVSEELEVLAFDLGAGPSPRLPRLGASPTVSVRIVRNARDFGEARRVETGVFSTPAPTDREYAEYAESLDRLEHRWHVGISKGVTPADSAPLAFRVLALVAGRPVASAGAEVAGRVLRLWGAGTLRAYRRRGAYRALVAARCREAHRLGATLALTKAVARTSGPTLRTAGFYPVSRERRLVLDLTPQPWTVPPPPALPRTAHPRVERGRAPSTSVNVDYGLKVVGTED